MKKIKIVIGSVVAIAAAAGVIFGIQMAMNATSSGVKVYQVSSMNSGWWGDTSSSYGTITANASQTVYLDGDQQVAKVFVEEGDSVSIGDKLFRYDKDLLQLEYESAKLDKKITKLEIEGAEADLKKLEGTTPIADTVDDSAEEADDLGNDITSPFDDNEEEYDEASAADVIQTGSVMVAAEITDGAALDAGITASDDTTIQEPESAGIVVDTEDTEIPEEDTNAIEEDAGIQEAPETETESESETESPEDIWAKDHAYSELNGKALYYKGTGTKEDPYVFFCTENATIDYTFMNMVFGFAVDGSSRAGGGVAGDGKGSYVKLEIREGDVLSGGFIKSMIINGTTETDTPFNPNVTWTFTSSGIVRNEVTADDTGVDDSDFTDDSSVFDDGDVYTVSELKKAIADKKEEIADLKLDLRENKLTEKKAKKKLQNATVKATINGVVKTIGDVETAAAGDEAFCVVTSDKGLYVKGSVSEVNLDTIQVGSVITGVGDESGMSFIATVTEISPYPSDSSNDYYSYDSGNPNSSSYPFLAYIEDSEGLETDESANLTINTTATEDLSTDVIYLEKMMIRTEGSQSYVYKEGEDGKLTKQYVRTGKTLYDAVIEVKEGITNDDWIAFPYGKSVKEGAKVVETEGSIDQELYY